MNKQVRNEILACLEQTYGDTKTALNYTTAFELLIAVILSAQCTDIRVNMITSRMFPRLNSAEKILELGQAGLEKEIRDCGLFHSKAKNILATCEILCQKYHGEVPKSFEELLTLPGVGRKTANVMLSVAFGQPALAVDTHVFRVANRLKLATGDTPLAIEEGLKKIIPREKWGQAHHWLIWHGRKICKARKPLCSDCSVSSLCPSSTVM
jgi:endonuclease III